MADNWSTGNASGEADEHRGWLLGHFIEPADTSVRTTSALEVKWGIHPAAQERPDWTQGEDRTTLVLLVSGRFTLNLTVGTTLLERQGDYATWGPGIDHSWRAEEDSVVITVRWPSLPSGETHDTGTS
ncbi:MAG: signal peptidase I [Streptosporangiaceae bacterium]